MLSQLEQLVRQRRFLAALEKAEELFRNDALPQEQAARAYHAASVAAYAVKQMELARDYATAAERLAGADWNLIGRVRQNLIEFLRQCGDLDAAIATGERWFADVSHYPELTHRMAEVHINLGNALRSADRNLDALRHFQAGARLMLAELEDCPTRVAPDTAFLAVQAVQMAAWLLFEQGDIEAGDEWLETMLPPAWLDDDEAFREQQLLEAWRNVHMRNFDAALDFSVEYLSWPAQAKPLQHFWAMWILGTAHAHTGDLDAAQKHADLATACATDLRQRRLVARASQLQMTIQSKREGIAS